RPTGRAVKFRLWERLFDSVGNVLSPFRRRTMPLIEVIPDPDRGSIFERSTGFPSPACAGAGSAGMTLLLDFEELI
ncbi:hypothetical protein, partial [Rhodocaloribacter sp.]